MSRTRRRSRPTMSSTGTEPVATGCARARASLRFVSDITEVTLTAVTRRVNKESHPRCILVCGCATVDRVARGGASLTNQRYCSLRRVDVRSRTASWRHRPTSRSVGLPEAAVSLADAARPKKIEALGARPPMATPGRRFTFGSGRCFTFGSGGRPPDADKASMGAFSWLTGLRAPTKYAPPCNQGSGRSAVW